MRFFPRFDGRPGQPHGLGSMLARRVRRRSRRPLGMRVEPLERRLLLTTAGDDTGAVLANETLTSANDYPPKVIADVPVGYWRMDESSGAAASDSVGGFDGAITGGVTLGAPGPLSSTGSAFVFNGANGKFDVPHASALNPAGSFTVEGWARVDGGQGSFRSMITSRDDIGPATDTRGYIIYAANNDTWQFWTGTGGAIGRPGAWDVLTGPAVVVGQWVHLAVTYEVTAAPDAEGVYRGIKSIYADGQLVARNSNGFYEPNQVDDLHVGAGADTGNSFFFNGSIDDVTVYDRALTSSEIQAHVSAGLLGNDQDDDPDDTLTVVAVDGDAGAVGNQVTAPSGALITVEADGSFHYDPNGAFSFLAPGATATDTIRYTASDTVGGINDGLIAHWPLNGDGANVAGDAHQGTVVGAPAAAAGQLDDSLDFAGLLDNRVDVPHDPALNPVNFTFSAWAMVQGGAGGYRSLVTSRDDIAGDQRGFIIYASNTDAWQFWTGRGTAGGGWDNLVGTPVVLDQWTHLAITFEATSGPDAGGGYEGNKILYVDGQPVASTVGFYQPNEVEPLHLGAGNDTGNQFFFDGQIDDAGFWNRPLSAAEVQGIYDSGVSGGDLPETDTANLVVTITGTGDASATNMPPIATDNARQVVEHGPTQVSGNLLTDDDGFGVDVDNDLGDATLITPADVTLDAGSEFFVVGNLIDGSGLSGVADIDNYASITHAGSAGSNAWVTDAFFPDYYSGGGPVPRLTFGLDREVSLTDAVFWNYSVPGNATRNVTLEFSTGGTDGPFGDAVTVEVPQAAGPAHALSLGGTRPANAVRITFDSNWTGVGAGGDRVGLAEVKFIGASADGLVVNDVDGLSSSSISGRYGALTWAADGDYTYDLDTADPEVASLGLGKTLVESFTYTLTDRNPLSDGLVLHADLNESAGATVAKDISGNGLHGTISGAEVAQSGIAGSAYAFDGVSDHVDLGTPASLSQLTSNLSVAAWIRPDGLGGIQRFFSSNPAGGWGFGANGTNLRFTTYGVRDYDLTLATPLENGQWTHVAAVMDTNNDVHFYVNGVSAGTLTHTAPGNSTAGNWYIGRGLDFEPFAGGIDDVAVWNRALSAGEIAAIHAGGVSGTSFQETDQARLTITVQGLNDPPQATDNAAEVTADGPLTDSGNLLTDDDGAGVDVDSDSDVGIARLVTPSGGTLDASSEFFVVGNLINDSGLSAAADIDNYAGITHAGSGSGNAWVTDAFFPDYYAGGGTVPVITLELDDVMSLTDAVFWNYSIPGNSTRTITMEFSTTGTDGPFGDPVTIEVPQAAGPAHTVSLQGARDANAVRMTIGDNWRGFGAGGDRVGLAEVKFVGSITRPLTVFDVDDQTDSSIPVAGDYGSLDWGSDGTYTYNLDNNHPDVQNLPSGSTLTDTFTYTIAERNGSTEGLVLHAKLDEAAGAILAADVSGNGLSGAITGAAAGGAGAVGSSFDFNGTSDVVDWGSPQELNRLTRNLTVSAWIHPDNLGGVQRIFSINPGGGWGFGANGTNLRFTTFGVRDYDLALPTPLANDAWTHVAAVMGVDNTVEFYVNGVGVGALTHGVSGNPGTGNWYVGGRGPGGEYFDGQIDDVAVWGRALGAETIAGIYSSGAAGFSFQETADASLVVTIGGSAQPINAEDDSVSVSEDGGPGPVDVTQQLLANDVPDARVVDIRTETTTGRVVLDASGNVGYDPDGRFESLAAGETATDTFTYSIAYVGETETDTATVTVTVQGTNDAPVVDAGGPYMIREGQSLVLAGLFTDVDATDPHVAGWDLDGDGTFDDAQPDDVLTWARLESLGIDDGTDPTTPREIVLRVDDGTEAVERVTTLTVANVAPTATASGPATAVANAPILFTFTADDPAAADRRAGFTYQIDWGDGRTETITGGGSSETVAHSFATFGPVDVNVTVTDKDGGAGSATTRVDVSPVGVIGDDIYIGGTDDVNDRIIIQAAAREQLFVRYNSMRFGPFDITATSTVRAFGGGGSDRISVSSCVTTELHGGDGNDALYGGPCDDALYGDDGRDTILTGEGTNLAEGGNGSDVIIGRSGDDELNGGGGNDQITGASGDDILRGDAGNDSLVGGRGTDLLVGGGGNDKMFGQGGHDVLIGGDGNDQLRGGENDDLMLGGFGLDGLRGERGTDLLAGGDSENEQDDDALLAVLVSWSQNRDTSELGALLDDGERDGLAAGGGEDDVYVGTDDEPIDAGNDRVFVL